MAHRHPATRPYPDNRPAAWNTSRIKACGPLLPPHPSISSVNRQNRIHDQSQAPQLSHHLLGLNPAQHDVAPHDAAEHPAIRHPRIVLEPDRMRRAAPWYGNGALMLTGDVDLEIGRHIPFDEFVLDEVVPVRLENGEDR